MNSAIVRTAKRFGAWQLGLVALYFSLHALATHWPHAPELTRGISIAARQIVPASIGADKVAHLGLYAVMTLLLVIITRARPISIAIVVATIGLLDEATQPYFGRTFDWLDWAADLAGMTLALGMAALVVRREAGEAISPPAARLSPRPPVAVVVPRHRVASRSFADHGDARKAA